MLTSLFLNNPQEDFTVYLLHSRLNYQDINDVNDFIRKLDQNFTEIYVSEHAFDDSPTHMHYTKEMYYRLTKNDKYYKEEHKCFTESEWWLGYTHPTSYEKWLSDRGIVL